MPFVNQSRKAQGNACIRPNSPRKVTKRYDKEWYRYRHAIEWLFGEIKRFRRVATRDEKKHQFYGLRSLRRLLVNLK